IAISLCDVLMRAGWVKRILFLCDRRELRKQADRVFKEFLPGEPRVIVGSDTASDREKRIYLSTYPAMMKCFEEFDVGFLTSSLLTSRIEASIRSSEHSFNTSMLSKLV